MVMLNPCHPGEILRDNLEAAELSVTEASSRLGCTRQALSRLLNAKAGISPMMALALERIGWSNASFWMRLQASYEFAQARLDRAAAEHARAIGSRGSIAAWAGEPSCSTIPSYRSSFCDYSQRRSWLVG